MNPRVSVIIPIYNGEKMVARALDSALNQSYPAHEIIVVDDGSKDGTPRMLERYAGRVIVKRIENSGASNARNVGIKLATGDLLAFLDHDDIWFRNYLKAQVGAMERHPQAGLACCNYAWRPGETGGRMVRHFSRVKTLQPIQQEYLADPFRLLFQECFIGTTSSVVFRPGLLKTVGFFDERFKISHDYDYWLRASTVTGFVVVREILLYKRVHEDNISGNLIRMMLDHKTVQEAFYASHADWLRARRLDRFCRLEMAKVNYVVGDLLFNEGRRAEFLRYLGAGLRWDASPANGLEFLKNGLKKLVRLATFDLLNRKRVNAALGKRSS